MKPKMKYSTSKVSLAKLNSSTGKALEKSCEIKRAQQKTKDICHVYYMRLRSGLTIKKEACYYRRETTRRCSIKTGGKIKGNQEFLAFSEDSVRTSFFPLPAAQEPVRAPTIPSIQVSCALSTYNDQSVSFVLDGESYVINVEELGKNQEKDKVLVHYYYDSPHLPSESGDVVDGKMLMVNLSPTNDKDILLHANNEERSVELQKCETPLPDKTLFVLHKKSTEYVAFECKSNRGTYIGVKDNHLALVEEQNFSSENIMFKLSMG